MRVVNGKAYSAFKECGWNSGDRAHTSGGHELSSISRYSITFALKTKMNNLFGKADGGSGGDCTNDSVSGDGGVNSLAAKMMERCFIIDMEDSDPENTAYAGRFGGFLQSLMKSKKD